MTRHNPPHKNKNKDGMTSTERKSVYSLASIYALRMMGLFMILPVFALYAEKLQGTTPALVGLAIGIYGLTQAALMAAGISATSPTGSTIFTRPVSG